MKKEKSSEIGGCLNILKRFFIVLYFIITVPLCGVLIHDFSDTYYRRHSEGYFFSATNPQKEFAGLLRVGYNSVPDDRSEILAKNDNDIIEHFLSKNPQHSGDYKKLINGEITSRSFAEDLFGTPSNYGLERKTYVGWINIIYIILIDLLIVLGYIILTDLLIKTGSYIINGKFTGGFNYKKLINFLKNRILHN